MPDYWKRVNEPVFRTERSIDAREKTIIEARLELQRVEELLDQIEVARRRRRVDQS